MRLIERLVNEVRKKRISKKKAFKKLEDASHYLLDYDKDRQELKNMLRIKYTIKKKK